MSRPTTIRLDEDLLRDLDRRAKAYGKDRATLLRELLRDALLVDRERRVVTAYRSGELSLSEAVQELGIDAWKFLDVLRARGETLNVTLEDWLDSKPATSDEGSRSDATSEATRRTATSIRRR